MSRTHSVLCIFLQKQVTQNASEGLLIPITATREDKTLHIRPGLLIYKILGKYLILIFLSKKHHELSKKMVQQIL